MGEKKDENQSGCGQTKTFLEADEQKENIERARNMSRRRQTKGQRSSAFLRPIQAMESASELFTHRPTGGDGRRHNVYIIAGANYPVPGNPKRGYTSQILVGPDGLVGRYNRTVPQGPGSTQEGVSGIMITRKTMNCQSSHVLLQGWDPYLQRGLFAGALSLLALKERRSSFCLRASASMSFMKPGVISSVESNRKPCVYVTCQNILGAEHGLP